MEGTGIESFESREQIIEHNLEMMDGQMIELLNEESIGGNAGKIEINGKKYTCASANGHIDAETGKILIFQNWQSVPEEFRSSPKFSLKLAFDIQSGGFFKIVGFEHVDIVSHEELLSPKVVDLMEETIDRWNTARIIKSFNKNNGRTK